MEGQSAVEAVSALGRANLRSVVLAVQAVQHDPDVVFEKRKATIVSIINGIFDASAGVFLIFKLVYDFTGWAEI